MAAKGAKWSNPLIHPLLLPGTQFTMMFGELRRPTAMDPASTWRSWCLGGEYATASLAEAAAFDPEIPMSGVHLRDARPADRDAIAAVTLAAYEQYGAPMGAFWEGYRQNIRAALAEVHPARQLLARPGRAAAGDRRS